MLNVWNTIYKKKKMVKLQVWMEFALRIYFEKVWKPVMYPNSGKLKGSHLSIKVSEN